MASRIDFRRVKIQMRMWFRIASFVVLCTGYFAYRNFIAVTPTPSAVVDAHISIHTLDAHTHRRLEGGSCPGPADPESLVVVYILGVLWLFVGLAIIADELFVPALDLISEKWDLSPDVAGATLMAAGGSSPELFTSAMGTFLRSSVGFGAIVGSAVFNILFVVGVCAIMTDKPMQLTWWPMLRDSSYYIITLIALSIFFGINTPQVIDWYEALILHLMYWLYVFIMYKNKELHAYFSRRFFGINIADSELTETSPLFLNPSRFRSGIASLLVKNKPFTETAGIHLVSRLNGRVDEAFKKFDKDGSGSLDAKEISSLLSELDLPASKEHVQLALSNLDANKDGTIDYEEFAIWYIKSKDRLVANVRTAFDRIDADKSGGISSSEVRTLLNELSDTPIGDDDVFEAIKEIRKGDTESYQQMGSTDISYKEFEKWYLSSAFMQKSEVAAEEQAEAAEGLNIYPPSGDDRTATTVFWYVSTLPFILAFNATVVDVRQPGRQKWVYLTFLTCLAWMGVFSFFMVTWVETIGATLKIPSVIMGLTFLAAGTSVPDMLSAVIVAKQGKGDQAVSSSIGSNVFDICVGLAFPWLLFWVVYQESILVEAGELLGSIIVLVVCLGVIFVTLLFSKWKLGFSSGVFFIALYFAYVLLQLKNAHWDTC